MPPAPTRPALLVLALCLVGAGAGGWVTWMGGAAFAHQRRLEREGVRTTARVTEARLMSGGSSSDSYELRYSFEVAGQPGVFTLGDSTGRSNLWATTDGRPQWDEARRTKSVPVLYLPADPRVNRLIREHGQPAGDAGVMVGMGLVVACVSLAIAGLEATGRGDRWRNIMAILKASLRPGGPS